jgi:hypothetical protein
MGCLTVFLLVGGLLGVVVSVDAGAESLLIVSAIMTLSGLALIVSDSKRRSNWTEVNSRWERTSAYAGRLIYCARDHVVFDPFGSISYAVPAEYVWWYAQQLLLQEEQRQLPPPPPPLPP